MTALDEAYERMSEGFELPNGFVNHGPMACEALAALGCDQAIDCWARRFARAGLAVTPRSPTPGHAFDWPAALGDYGRLPDWIGFLEQEIDRDGWATVVARWVPRLLSGLDVALFHGAIRTAHAVRAISTAETAPRRAELARSVAYWAARFRPAAPPEVGAGEAPPAAAMQATGAAAYYVAEPNIFNLHGVTGAMAVDLLGAHLADRDRTTGLRQLQADLARMHRDAVLPADPDPAPDGRPDFAKLAEAAAASRDPHQVKLVEACRRALTATGQPVFATAALTVSGVRSHRRT